MRPTFVDYEDFKRQRWLAVYGAAFVAWLNDVGRLGGDMTDPKHVEQAREEAACMADLDAECNAP